VEHAASIDTFKVSDSLIKGIRRYRSDFVNISDGRLGDAGDVISTMPGRWQENSGDWTQMPIVQVNMMQGRTREQKRALLRGITEAVVQSLAVDSATVRVMIHELTQDDYAIAGVSLGEYKRSTADERGNNNCEE